VFARAGVQVSELVDCRGKVKGERFKVLCLRELVYKYPSWWTAAVR